MAPRRPDVIKEVVNRCIEKIVNRLTLHGDCERIGPQELSGYSFDCEANCTDVGAHSMEQSDVHHASIACAEFVLDTLS